MTIFFVVGSIPVTVLEVDTKVFDRLALQLLDHPRVDDFGPRSQIDGPPEGRCVWREFIKRAERQRAEAPGGVGLEELSAPINGVHRLAPTRVAGIARREHGQRILERCTGAYAIRFCKRDLHRDQRLRMPPATA